ncbi:MAG: pyridine nucleotide-disulfide oxidoreductase [Burkholderiales bacterium]|nr:MAG: pyridine nucleotide-disulfide oxidoreductase [Burkholderiales bacterium]
MADAAPGSVDSTTAALGAGTAPNPDAAASGSLELAFGLDFPDLYDPTGLQRLDACWLAFVDEAAPALGERYRAARAAPDALDAKAEAALLIEAGPVLDAFVARLFGIEEAFAELRASHAALDPLWRVKWKFVKRQALLSVTPEQLAAFDADAARARLAEAITAQAGTDDAWTAAGSGHDELTFARAVLAWQADAPTHDAMLELAKLYAAWAVTTHEGQARHAGGVLFRQPGKVDPYELLVHARTRDEAGTRVTTIRPEQIRRRLDHARAPFALTDPGTDLAGALDQTNYCILCHKQGKDSCSKGLRDKPGPDGEVVFKRSAFGNELAGCPLEERISEFHTLKNGGHAIAALAMIVVDNPMLAATGHRICNDCMKGCIYQKQTPVDIPQAETRTLKDVLELPWGFEIYSLLSRWNPLNLRRPAPAADSGRRVLVVGTGPAGFTLAHHLMNDGHQVVSVDGLKIEPLPAALSGVDADGTRRAFEPVRDVAALYESLDDRTLAGFGGVAEYGITVRWNKNFLKLIRLLLERRARFTLIGGVRFGGTLGVDDAWRLGFDHIALAIGAGRPTTLDIPNGLARGVRTASDFLMALQLTGAAKADSIANMQLRLPVVVIGGGLTAIDTATESLAYYVVQVDKFLVRHETLAARHGETAVRAGWSDEEREVADEFLAHGRAIRQEREAARAERRPARIVELLDGWGGVTIAYRKRLVDAPSYTLNHEEVEKALEEGIRFAECLDPRRIDVDARGAVRAITLACQRRDDAGRWRSEGELVLPARSVFVAAGTQPNTVLAREAPEHFTLDGRYFQALDETGRPVTPEFQRAKPAAARVLMSGQPGGRWISYFGDVHPSWFGNVVKAMGSAKQGWPVIARVLAQRAPSSDESTAAFAARLNGLLRARVVRVERLAPNIVEVVMHAPMAAAHFEPGQFYRLQNFESRAARVEAPGLAATRLAMEGLALTGAWVDKSLGLVSTIVLEMGGSSDLCRRLEPGEPVVLMGPTGSPTQIASGETVVLAGGGLGNAVLFSIGAAFRAAGSKVLYFAGYKKRVDRYKVAEIEAAADVVVWCCDESPGFAPTREQDRAFDGNIVQAMLAWATGAPLRAPAGIVDDGRRPLRLADGDRIVAIGSDRMMAAVALARHGVLAPHVKPGHRAIGSINSPMQCMMKEICAQCLQPQVDPATGRTRYVFSCFDQDQPLDLVDFGALDARLRQNSVQEKLTARWIAECLRAFVPA